MAKAHLKLVTPATVKRTVTPKRLPNGKLRTREYLTEAEVERLMAAAKGNRYGHRDATMALVAYRHGLRASELVDLRWEQVDFRTASLHVRRVKQGNRFVHNQRQHTSAKGAHFHWKCGQGRYQLGHTFPCSSERFRRD
jgi:integrase